MPLQPGFLYCQLAYEPDKTGYLAGWTLLKSFAPPLRIQRGGKTLESAPHPHKTPISSTYRPIQKITRKDQQTINKA